MRVKQFFEFRLRIEMAIALKPLSWLSWRGKKIQEPKIFLSETSSEMEMWESDTLKFPVFHNENMKSSRRRVRKNLRTRVEKKMDKEHDAVLVPSDGGCVSGSESDDSDWSIGWLEPHGPSFQSDDLDNSFAVLVPCYGRGRGYQEDNSKSKLSSTIGNISDLYAAGKTSFTSKQLLPRQLFL